MKIFKVVSFFVSFSSGYALADVHCSAECYYTYNVNNGRTVKVEANGSSYDEVYSSIREQCRAECDGYPESYRCSASPSHYGCHEYNTVDSEIVLF